MMYVYSAEAFYNQFASAILKATSGKVEDFLQMARNILRGARVTINTGTGEPTRRMWIIA